MSEQPYAVKSVGTAFQIIQTLNEHGQMGVTEIADGVGVTKGTVHKHLSTLNSLGYVTTTAGQYQLSLRFLGIGSRTQNRSKLFQRSRAAIDNLSSVVETTTNIIIKEQDTGVYLYRAGEITEIGQNVSEIGEPVPLHATAGGKAILSQLPRETVDSIIESAGLTQFTDKTITTPERLYSELQTVKDQRLAYERGEHVSSIQCVAAPINIPTEPVGAVTISGSTDQMSGKILEEDFAGLVTSAAKEIELAVLKE